MIVRNVSILLGLWIDCSTLRLTITTTPSTPLFVEDGLLIELRSAGGRSGQGVRDPSSQSFASSGTVDVSGSFGELQVSRTDSTANDTRSVSPSPPVAFGCDHCQWQGPYLLSAIADDPDDGDAIFGDGDTLTLTFNQATDTAGAAIGEQLPPSWLQLLLDAPSFGSRCEALCLPFPGLLPPAIPTSFLCVALHR